MSTAIMYQTKQTTACTPCIDRNLQRRRAVFRRQHGFLVLIPNTNVCSHSPAVSIRPIVCNRTLKMQILSSWYATDLLSRHGSGRVLSLVNDRRHPFHGCIVKVRCYFLWSVVKRYWRIRLFYPLWKCGLPSCQCVWSVVQLWGSIIFCVLPVFVVNYSRLDCVLIA